MKIALMSFFVGQNYGGLLQSWALYRIMSQMGHEVKLIDYHHPWSTAPHWWSWRSYLARNPKWIWINTKRVLRQFKLRRQFSKMESLYPRTDSKYGSNPNLLMSNPPKADAYVVGSDQVWRMGMSYYRYVRPYLLPFGPDEIKRVAYAASMGGGGIPVDLKDDVSKLLARFSSISVREPDGAGTMASIGINDVVVMPDPTLVLGRQGFDELRTFADDSVDSDCVYYVMDGISDIAREAIYKYADEKTVNIALQNFRLNDSRDVIPEVPQFVDLIARTKVVVTNSFHGTVFSLLYHKPFVYVEFVGDQSFRNNRARHLLSCIGLLNRSVSIESAEQISQVLKNEIEWNEIDAILGDLRRKAEGWLHEKLNCR